MQTSAFEPHRNYDETLLMFFDSNNLYHLHEMQHASMAPIRMLASAGKHVFNNPMSPVSYTPAGRHMAAASELIERITQAYPKPEFGLKKTTIEGKSYNITEEVVWSKPFCDLLHFKKAGKHKQEKILVVAPMSGHYATLLRGTVEALLPHHDVYITDWMNASEVPIGDGKFDLDDYIDYLIEMLQFLGKGAHTLAVCQPSVPLFAAVAVMSAHNDKCTPKTMTLMGGPIDTRQAPTQVNQLAQDRSIHWFENNVVSRVPFNYPGFMRRVYPGFLQLTGFMTMNLDRHVGEHVKLFNHLIDGDGESVAAHRKFYNEYLAVADLPAEFYLQTVVEVFQKHSLPKGKFMHNGEYIKPEAIKNTAILCIEGEKDDISGLGQTKAALDIADGLAKSKKKYHMQKGAGHYGIFNGRKWREQVRPVISDWIEKHS